MAGSIEKSIVNTSTTSIENYKTTNTIFKRYTQKIIANIGTTYFEHCANGLNALKFNSSKKQKLSPHTVEDIKALINDEKYQDAEKKITKMLKKGCNISDRDRKGNNLLHCIAVLPKEGKIKLTSLVINKTSKKEDLKLAINTKNHRGYTPLQEALSRKIQKPKHKLIHFKSDNTMKLFVLLLNHGAKVNDFRSFDNKLCYEFLKKLKNSESLEQDKKDEVRCLQKKLKSKYEGKPTKTITIISVLTILMSIHAFFQGTIEIQLFLPIIIVSSITMSAPTIVQGIGDNLCSFFTNMSLSKAKEYINDYPLFSSHS